MPLEVKRIHLNAIKIQRQELRYFMKKLLNEEAECNIFDEEFEKNIFPSEY